MSRWSFPITPGNSLRILRDALRLLGCFSRAVLVVWYVAGMVGGVCLAATEDGTAERAATALAIAPPLTHPTVGERLGFHGRWFGIPVGYGWIEVKGIEEIAGRRAYHIEAQGHTNEVLSALYPIHDVVDSYLDVETLRPLRFEKHQHEGHYRADEEVTFDYGAATATYRSLLNRSVKQIPLPREFQDIISAMYWLRFQPIHPHQHLSVNIYTDEKIFETSILIERPMILELRRRGTFPCLVVEPQARFKGLLIRRGRIWAYLTSDARRLPVLVRATTPWGAMSLVLDAVSIMSDKIYSVK